MSKLLFCESNVKGTLITMELTNALREMSVMKDKYIVIKSDVAKLLVEFDGITFNAVRNVYVNKKYRLPINTEEFLIRETSGNAGCVYSFNGVGGGYGDTFMMKFMEYLSCILINDDNNTALVVTCDNKLEANKVFESKAYKLPNALMMCGVDLMKEQRRQYYVFCAKGEFTEHQLYLFLNSKGLAETKSDVYTTVLSDGLYLVGEFEIDALAELQDVFKAKQVKCQTKESFIMVGKDCDVTVYDFHPTRYSKYEEHGKVVKFETVKNK